MSKASAKASSEASASRMGRGVGLGVSRAGLTMLLSGLAVAVPTFASVLPARGLTLERPGETAPPERLPVELIAAQGIARAVAQDLKLAGPPKVRDFQIATEALRTAVQLAPEDQTVLRLALEAAQGAEDTARVRELASMLVKLDPLDTVAQLRVISANIADLQTTDERLAVYQRFLGPAGSEVDAGVRSRLALDAALLLRERGDVQAFAQTLAKAVELDPTNKDAATLALAFYTSRQADPAGKLDLMLGVLYADPFDPQVYRTITQHLLSRGAYAGAERFAKLLRSLSDSRGYEVSEQDRELLDLTEWNRAGADAVIRRLSGEIERARLQATVIRKEQELAGRPTDGIARPEDIRLPMVSERVRLLAAASIGDKERASLFLSDFSESARRAGERLGEPGRRAEGLTEADAMREVQQILAETVWMRLWSGLDIEAAQKGLEILEATANVDRQTVDGLKAWMDLRTGKLDAAEAAFRARVDSDPTSLLGLGAVAEARGDSAQALARYRELATAAPGGLAGAYARSRAAYLSAGPAPAIPEAEALEATVRNVPDWLEKLMGSARSFMALEVLPLRSDISPVERTPVRITLRNIAPIPLAVGPDGPINTRILMAPTAEVGPARLPTAELIEVAHVDRRLRLLPNEQFEAIVWPDLGAFSQALEAIGTRQARVRWRVLQGFRLGAGRVFEAGPGCLAADTPAMLRKPPARFEAVPEAMRYALQVSGGRELADAILSLKLRASLGPEAIDPGELDRLVEILARRYQSLQRASRIMLLTLMPTQPNLGPAVRIDQIAQTDKDEGVLAVLLALRAGRKDDPAFAESAVVNSPRLSRLAKLVRERLNEGVPTYATNVAKAPDLVVPAAPMPTPAPPPLELDPRTPSDGKPADPAAPGDASSTPTPVAAPDPSPVPMVP